MTNSVRKALFLNNNTFLTPREKYYLLTNTISVETLCSFTHADIQQILGRRILYTSWDPQRALTNAEQEYILCKGRDIHVLTLESFEYPQILKTIYDPPIVLYVWGNSKVLKLPKFSVVGTRKANKKGLEATKELCRILVRYGWTIVSGLALGIDGAAHQGAIMSKQAQIAVLGTRILDLRPKQNRDLARSILLQGGAILSEIGPRGTVHKHSFVSRNRIISGLSYATCIVQAPHKSGALHTAYFAIEQGREVFVHKAGLDEAYQGTIQLYKEGVEEIRLDTIPLPPL